ncbi:dTMP kinase [Fusobacterium perfoetens]|uniref:dTMP kinase n=1 Tax=Fusobacterium perfoetens TaxID=852 RepID=UPI000485A7B8|nr:deoxynucleoside kinase [Fusobacterium perfoetens]MCI6152567.1 deoxynucleoside kinase [Fusobacterium perfoetens]MDY3237575.1 deoxynucleoside kinase [Fusobacterium perfoetens]
MGKIIVIEGTDSSGKETQTNRLFEKLLLDKLNVKKITFPNYDSPACAPVKMYLAGEFGETPLKVNPYPISTMFAIDRYASFKKDWEEFYNNNGVIVTDRYVQSNIIHQASKLATKEEKRKYIEWLEDLEFEKIGIPRADLVIFINMPLEFAKILMANRKNKITGEEKKDIHERDEEYMRKSYENACEVAKTQGWTEVNCVENGRLKTIEEISEEIYKIVKNKLEER